MSGQRTKLFRDSIRRFRICRDKIWCCERRFRTLSKRVEITISKDRVCAELKLFTGAGAATPFLCGSSRRQEACEALWPRRPCDSWTENDSVPQCPSEDV